MKRIFAVLMLLCATSLTADEGMWQPSQLPELRDTLRDLGLELDPENLADLMQHPMNAVISLGGCTASFVSPEGLVVTNHHCAYGSIQHNSTDENNLIANGFLAKTQGDELPAAPGSRVLVTVAVEDVTESIMGRLPAGVEGRERYEAIENLEKEIVAGCEKDAGHRCNVYRFHGGLSYQLIKQLEIRDVRLVYAPSRDIGEFGGDIDNWMWPRHTGDYSFYRAYVDPQGHPADFSKDNQPYQPKHHLKVNTGDLSDGDFVMVAGYPGATYRYRLASEVENRINWYYPVRKRLYQSWLDTIDAAGGPDSEVGIKYASLNAGLNNAIKNYQGMLDGFSKSDVVERKRRLEAELQAWIEADDTRKARHASALAELRALVDRVQATQERGMLYEYLARRGELYRTARTLYRLSLEKAKPDLEREPGYQERDWVRIKERMARIERTFTPEVDRAFWRQFILEYAATPPDQHVTEFDEKFGIDGNSVDEAELDRHLDKLYDGTSLGDLEARLAWMDADPKEFEASDDPFIRLAVAMYDSDQVLEGEEKELAGLLDTVRPRYMEAIIAYRGSRGEPVYPDANSTLRVTYGTVKGYSPRDALVYTPFTTVRGVAQKNTGEFPFAVPEEELEAISERRFGRWIDEDLDSVAVNFLSTVDTTGGNSGSPTLNARGELTGLLFDGVWESIIADWDFIPGLTRSIHVDIRYVLWIMDELDGAGHLLREMGVDPK